MASNIEVIVAALQDDPILTGDALTDGLGVVTGYTGILSGGVWDRRLKREPPGNTPQAFTSADEMGRLIRPAASVRDRGDIPHRQRLAIPSAYDQPVHIFLYAPATRSGKVSIKDARRRIYDILNDTTFVTEDGPIAFLYYVDRVGTLDSEEFPEAVYDSVRYRITSRLGNEV